MMFVQIESQTTRAMLIQINGQRGHRAEDHMQFSEPDQLALIENEEAVRARAWRRPLGLR